MKLKWTTHGAVQLAERTAWSPDDVQRLLDEDKTVCVGIDVGKQIKGNRKGGRRVHSLAYDERSTDWFVVVWDENTGEVVTVLSLAFHNRCAWRVAEGALKVAKEKVVPPPLTPEKPVPVQPQPKPNVAKFHVTAYVRITASLIQAVHVGRFDNRPPASVVREKLKEHNLDHLEIGCVVVKRGRADGGVAYHIVEDEYVVKGPWKSMSVQSAVP